MILLQKCNPLVPRQQKTSRSLSEAWKRSAGYVAYKTADYSVTAGVITALATDLRINLRSDSDWRSSIWQQCARRAPFCSHVHRGRLGGCPVRQWMPWVDDDRSPVRTDGANSASTLNWTPKFEILIPSPARHMGQADE